MKDENVVYTDQKGDTIGKIIDTGKCFKLRVIVNASDDIPVLSYENYFQKSPHDDPLKKAKRRLSMKIKEGRKMYEKEENEAG